MKCMYKSGLIDAAAYHFWPLQLKKTQHFVQSLNPVMTKFSFDQVAREKSLISRAMDELTRTIGSENGDSGADSDQEEEVVYVEGNLIAESMINFRLASPSPLPAYLNVHFICETASRLLFLSVHWVRSIPAFSVLK